jgi:hypothetical protein
VGRHCRKFEEFSTFFDATRPIPSFAAEDVGSLLPVLTVLCVCVSVITCQVLGNVAKYLSRILPRKCEIAIIQPDWPGKSDGRDGELIIDRVSTHHCILLTHITEHLLIYRRWQPQSLGAYHKSASKSLVRGNKYDTTSSSTSAQRESQGGECGGGSHSTSEARDPGTPRTDSSSAEQVIIVLSVARLRKTLIVTEGRGT